MSSILGILQVLGVVMIIVIVALYVVTIIWVIRDAPRRGISPTKWGIVALIPFIGALIYSALRPPMFLADKEEQDLDCLLRERELMRYGECGRCSYPVMDDYVMCPNCGSQLKNVCKGCKKPLNPSWTVCPWCCTKTDTSSERRPRRRTDSHSDRTEGHSDMNDQTRVDHTTHRHSTTPQE